MSEPKQPFIFYSIEQPDPVDGGRPVGSSVRALFKQILEHQEAKGLKKYGTVLQTFNGRNPLLDLLGELIDAVQYATQALLEQNSAIELDCEIRGGARKHMCTYCTGVHSCEHSPFLERHG